MLTLLGVICGDAICGSIVPLILCPFPPCFTGPFGSCIGLEVGGSVGGFAGATGVLLTGLYEGLAPCVGGLCAVLGGATGGLFQICGELTNVCNAIF